MLVYLIGSLRNPEIPAMGNKLREAGLEVFDDWYAPGPEADDMWKRYEEARGHTYKEALKGWAATHVYEFDKFHLDRADIALLALPAGRSCHLELGYMIGKGKRGYILLPDMPEEDLRWDVMYKFADGVFFNIDELIVELKSIR